MVHNKDVINCLPLLASVLGDRYGVEVHIGGDTACTDGKVIHLPGLPVDCDRTALALAKGYVDHESAHIRHTDFEALAGASLDKVTSHVFNSIEDWRVEQWLSALYSGCRQNIDWLIRRFFVEEKDEGAGEKSPALTVLSYILLTVRAWDVPEVNAPRTRARDIIEGAYSGLPSRLDVALDRVRHDCPDTMATIEAAKELVRIIRSFRPQIPAASQAAQGEKGMSDTASSCQSECPEQEGTDNPAATLPTDSGKAAGSDSHAVDERTDGSDCACETGHAGTEAGKGIPDLNALLDACDGDSLPGNLGERIAARLSGEAASDTGNRLVVVTPGYRFVGSLSPEELAQALRCSTALRHRLQGLLQARELRQVASARRGKLDVSRLYRLSSADPRVFRRESRQLGQNSAVHLLLDCSGSMSGEPIRLARQACYAVAKVLEPIRGVNAAVTAFPAIVKHGEGIRPLVRHGEKVTEDFGVEGSGGTPLAPALWWIVQNLYAQKEERKIVLVITDGMPDEIEACRAVLSRMRALRMEVYGIGIRQTFIEKLLPKTSRVISTLPELAPAMFGLLQVALLRRGDR